jgi:hypothetical protein
VPVLCKFFTHQQNRYCDGVDVGHHNTEWVDAGCHSWNHLLDKAAGIEVNFAMFTQGGVGDFIGG